MNKGFTLIEMIVATAVFIVVIVSAMAAFLNMSDIQRKTTAFRAINDNLNFAVETMTREIRSGSGYNSSVNSFSFTNVNGDGITYALSSDRLIRTEDGNSFILTAPEAKIIGLNFIVAGNGASGGDGQPRVTIVINGFVGEKEKTKSALNLQATVSQRKPDPDL